MDKLLPLTQEIVDSFTKENPTLATRTWDSFTGNSGIEYSWSNSEFKVILNKVDWALGTIEDDIWYEIFRKVPVLYFFRRWGREECPADVVGEFIMDFVENIK